MTERTGEGDALPLSALQDRAEAVARDLVQRKLVTADEVADVRPGGSDNPETGALGWLRCFERLVRLHAAGMGARTGGPVTPDQQDEMDEALASALAEVPHPVVVAGAARAVYPKSYHALRFLDMLDGELRLIHAAATAASEGANADELKVKVLAPMMESLAVRTWAWVLTSEGPELPFDEMADAVEPPEWTKTLSPDDLLALLRAHQEVHARRLAMIATMFPPEPGDAKGRMTIASFLGATIKDRPNAARRIMRQTSLGAVFAASVSSAAAQREALKHAKRTSRSES